MGHTRPGKGFQLSNKAGDLPVYVKMEQVYLRLHEKSLQHAAIRPGNNSDEPGVRFEDALLFANKVSAASEQTSYVYFSTKVKEDTSAVRAAFTNWCRDQRNLLRKVPSNGEINAAE